MYKYILVIFGLSISIPVQTQAQVNIPRLGNHKLTNGYARAIMGESISYFSIYPDFITDALLTRCTDGKKVIEWETDPVPAGVKEPYVYFSWVAAHSTGTSSGIRKFDLYINGEYKFTFNTYPKQYPDSWTFGGSDSTRLVFKFITKDGANDSHGIAYLRVPYLKDMSGKPLRIKVVGEDQNSNDWYMTFKFRFEERIIIDPMPFLLREGNGSRQTLLLTALHFGGPGQLKVTADDEPEQSFDIVNGMNSFEIPVNAVSENKNIHIHAEIPGTLTVDREVLIRPVIPRDIYFIHHSHNDIGYSDVQEDVVKKQNKNLYTALDLIDKTNKYPEGSRFIWNSETLWPVENFLSTASDKDRDRFIHDVKSGRICLSGTYVNILTGLCQPKELDWNMHYADYLRDSLGLPISTAFMTDIPGMSWSMVDALARNGIRYFSNGPNAGDRIGGTLSDLGDKPFWWLSTTSRDSILFWTAGKGYSSFHGFNQGTIFEKGRKKIASYMLELDSLHYPYSMVQWRYNIGADNGPVDTTVADFVKSWNKKYIQPKIILANAADMFKKFEGLYGNRIPVYSGDFTPYWEDGAYSTALEESENRLLAMNLIRLESLIRQYSIPVDPHLLYHAEREIIMFDEHTWGSWNSISDPDNPFTIHQWNYKKSFVDSAGNYVNRINKIVTQSLSNESGLRVYNTLDWSRTDFVETDATPWRNADALVDDHGKIVVIQKLHDGKIGFIAEDVPAHGYRTFTIYKKKLPKTLPEFKTDLTLVTIDSTYGSIKSLEVFGKDWVNRKNFGSLGDVLYVNGLDPRNFSTSSFSNARIEDNGSLLLSMRTNSTLPGTNGVTYVLSAFSGLPYLKLSVTIDKKPIRDKESVHIALPLNIEDPEVRIGFEHAVMEPGKNQIPGSNYDFYSVQKWIDLSGENGGITFVCPQGALYELDSMVDERRINGVKVWRAQPIVSSNLFLYAMNNYWHTNYKADQEGKVTFDFYMMPHRGFNKEESYRFGREMTEPLFVVP